MPATGLTFSRLLLCSTNEQKLEPLQRRLAAAGIDIDCATRAEDVRQQLWNQHYDGIAIDLLLADRDGISFAMELREEHPWMPILVVSTTQQKMHDDSGPDWLNRAADYARLVFALKQAGQYAAGRISNILHIENDDSLAELVQNTLGGQTRLFRARSAQEARIALALRSYDLALVRTQMAALSDQWKGHLGATQPALCVSTDATVDPFITILNNLRPSVFVHEPAYC